MSRKRIMVVEDEGITAMRIQNSLEDMGHFVTSTEFSGMDAIKRAEENRPDLVLMDIVLHGEMDGIEDADEIRSKYDIPVVYLTAYQDKEISENSHKCVRMKFHDNGTGIPLPIMGKILNPFFTTKPDNAGTGLGLSISHGIIADHKGKLVIDSVEGAFTEVMIELPSC